MNGSEISEEIGRWFKNNRELYEWPPGCGRWAAEVLINCLCEEAKTSFTEARRDILHSSLVKIHRWKTQNRQGQTSKYCKTLEVLGMTYLNSLIRLGPFVNKHNLGILIENLKVKNCNLPVCTAIASFLYGRQAVPIIDKFLSQFFAQRFNFDDVDKTTKQVLSYVRRINFSIEDGGAGRLRLAVYTCNGFNYNLNKYLNEFVPECARIARDVNKSITGYNDIHGHCVEFLPIDVEMAVFSWAIRNRELFQKVER